MQRVERIAFTLLIAGILAALIVLALMLSPSAETHAGFRRAQSWRASGEEACPYEPEPPQPAQSIAHPAAAPAGSEIRYPTRSDRHNARAHEEDRT